MNVLLSRVRQAGLALAPTPESVVGSEANSRYVAAAGSLLAANSFDLLQT
ncbi:MAG: hypothetical protein ACE361_03270 [Aureliella sp.]